MFNAIKKLFSKTPEAPRAAPELVDTLVDIANPNIKLARKYQDRLSPYVYWAQSHAAQFTAQWPSPIALSPENWRQQRILQLLFATPARMGELIGQNPMLHTWFAHHPFIESCFVVFTADSRQKMRYGMVEEGGQIRQDVPQQVLQFSAYRVQAPTETCDELISAAPKRILEVVAAQSSLQIAALDDEKTQLESELLNARTMLRMAKAHSPEYQHQQERINTLTQELQQCNTARSPDALCEVLITDLAATPDILTLQKQILAVDSMGVIGSGMGDEMPVELSELVLQGQENIRKLMLIFEVPRNLLQAPNTPTPFTGDVRF